MITRAAGLAIGPSYRLNLTYHWCIGVEGLSLKQPVFLQMTGITLEHSILRPLTHLSDTFPYQRTASASMPGPASLISRYPDRAGFMFDSRCLVIEHDHHQLGRQESTLSLYNQCRK